MNKEKWSCEYCTYANFPAAKECVMCFGCRPLQVITDLENSEQDIYKMAELSLTAPKKLKTEVCDEDKWSCKKCTYLNSRQSKRCVQCGGHKNSPRTSSQPDFLKKTLSIQISQAESDISGKASPNRCSPKSPESSSQLASKQSTGCVRNIVKWVCKACTYENWPKSQKCVICSTPRLKKSNSPSGNELCSRNLEVQTVSSNLQDSQSSTSGQNSPNDNSGSNSPNNNRASPNNNQSRKTSPVNNRNSHAFVHGNKSGQNSPNLVSGSHQNRSGQSSPNSLRARENNDSNRTRGKGETSDHIIEEGASAMDDNKTKENKLQKLRKCLRDMDHLWLQACEGVVDGDLHAVETYLTNGGDPGRALTKEEVLLMDRPSAFEVGYTLVHLALRFKTEDILAVLLTGPEISAKGFKRLPSYSCPDLDTKIRREISMSIRQRKGEFQCSYMTDCVTFALPAEIEDLPRDVTVVLFEELLDGDVEKELTEEGIINWNIDLIERLGSRLYALWNRTAGDCLLDSVLQATWGVLDVENMLRQTLSDTLKDTEMSFYPRWKEYESMQANILNYSLDENQWQKDWSMLVNLAAQPGSSLDQLHIFALAHILRRPIIVYGVKVIKSFRGENIGYVRFEGVYLPFLWERSFCYKTPISLGYTRGHFSSLVPMEMVTDIPVGAGANIDSNGEDQITYLPLVDHEGSFLPIHFIKESEIGQEETIMRRWMDCCVTDDGLLVAVQNIGKRPPLVKEMIEKWLDHYRQQSSQLTDTLPTQTFTSDWESD
ncbi:hypothetical protein CHS0354_004463 [Potamilus streckersoni]|uniref:ubiquitinyl hydrolase 1 n=1 Tax=Potamilus streckersoni TaxID=2493646 RepID=A0AAE0SNK5_9BIVA|nr:hypothetical protein CHS0354_004463 [Potamilus streckersoni]